MDTTGVALLGFGHWGRNLARNFARLGALRAVSDPDPRALEAAGKAYPDARLTADWEEPIADPAVRACAIAAPAALHYELARRALEAGKDVFVEKPLALTAKEGEALVELAEKQERILMVGHLLEYHPATEALRALVAKGELGKIQYVYSNRLNLGRIRTEENALWSFAPHDVHVMLRLLGEAPVEVACQGGSYLSHQLADVTMSMMTFASGVRGHIFVSWLHPFKEQKLVIIGDRAMAVFDDGQLMRVALCAEAPQGIFNVSTGEGHTVAEVFDAVASCLGISPAEPVPVVPPNPDDITCCRARSVLHFQCVGVDGESRFLPVDRPGDRLVDAHGVSTIHSHLQPVPAERS
jgi:predicted dehydrogenase